MNRDFKQALRSKAVSDGGCWVWSTSTNTNGYGWTGIRGLPRLAHRAAYQTFKGDIPKGMGVCHSCDRPGCINPEHLFLGTQRDNLRDAAAKGRVHGQAKTHCNRGHEFTPENTYAPRPGQRECRACKRETGRKASENYRAKRRAALTAALSPAPSSAGEAS